MLWFIVLWFTVLWFTVSYLKCNAHSRKGVNKGCCCCCCCCCIVVVACVVIPWVLIHYVVVHWVVIHCVVIHWVVIHCAVVRRVVIHCAVVHCVEVHCVVVYCVVVHCVVVTLSWVNVPNPPRKGSHLFIRHATRNARQPQMYFISHSFNKFCTMKGVTLWTDQQLGKTKHSVKRRGVNTSTTPLHN